MTASKNSIYQVRITEIPCNHVIIIKYLDNRFENLPFEKLPKSIEKIYFSKNSLTFVNSTKLSGLKLLDVRDNKIKYGI